MRKSNFLIFKFSFSSLFFNGLSIYFSAKSYNVVWTIAFSCICDCVSYDSLEFLPKVVFVSRCLFWINFDCVKKNPSFSYCWKLQQTVCYLTKLCHDGLKTHGGSGTHLHFWEVRSSKVRFVNSWLGQHLQLLRKYGSLMHFAPLTRAEVTEDSWVNFCYWVFFLLYRVLRLMSFLSV